MFIHYTQSVVPGKVSGKGIDPMAKLNVMMSEVSEVMQPEWPHWDTSQLGTFSVKSSFAQTGQRMMALKSFKQGLPVR